MDLNAGSQRDVSATLTDMDRYNRFIGGTSFLRRYVFPRLRAGSRGRVQRVLDVGCGAAGMALAVAAFARREHVALTIIAMDLDSRSLVAARERTPAGSAVAFVQADASALPFRDKCIDLTFSTLLMHHLHTAAAEAAVSSLLKACRGSVLVNDLVRNSLAWWLFRAVSVLMAKNNMSRLDGLTSIRRSYNPSELFSIFQRAGCSNVTIAEHPLFFRMTAIGETESE